MSLESIPLSEKTKQNLQQVGYHQLTNIQLKVIPLILEGWDMIAQSQTGTGKTAAFLIPMGEKITRSTKPQALILVPTRELALQVSEEGKKLFANKLRIAAVYGGSSIHQQLQSFRQGVEIIVGTPGRIIDHIFTRRSFHLDHLQMIVLDEVDEMISQGFLPEVEKIIKKIPSSRQTLLFSATISPQVEEFAQKFAKNPKLITSETTNLPSNTEHYYLEINSPRQKTPTLINFLASHKPDSMIIFANTKRRVEIVKDILGKNNLRVDYIHSGLSQSRRTRVFQKFRAKKTSVLIATDVAARGLDIKDISYVINYDFPQNREFYIHRTGRTGRAGASGKALTFVSFPQEKRQLLAIARQRKFELEKFILS
jgi:ATP-dependent RNA helicase DeaD